MVQVDAINHWAGRVRELEAGVGEARQRALRSQPTGSFFVFFSDQKAAATAAQAVLQSEDGREFRVSQVPPPALHCLTCPALPWHTFRGEIMHAGLANAARTVKTTPSECFESKELIALWLTMLCRRRAQRR